MRINELLIENNQIDEISLGGVGGAVNKTAGAIGGIAGGVVGAGQALAKGYKAGKAYVGGQPTGTAAGTTGDNATGMSTAAGGSTAGSVVTGGGQDPNSLRQQAAALTKQADELEKTQTTTQDSGQTAPTGTPPAQSPEEIRKTKQADAAKVAQDQMAAPKPGNSPAAGGTGFGFDGNTGLPFNSQAERDAGLAKQKADKAAAAGTPPPTGGKMTPAQQAALKDKLQGQRQAGKTTATQTGSGFKDYVGGSQEKMAGVDASGAPVFKKLQRESVGFSNFLGMAI
jgi:hypothetical protein